MLGGKLLLHRVYISVYKRRYYLDKDLPDISKDLCLLAEKIILVRKNKCKCLDYVSEFVQVGISNSCCMGDVNNRNYSLIALEVRNLQSRCWQGWCLLTPGLYMDTSLLPLHILVSTCR